MLGWPNYGRSNAVSMKSVLLVGLAALGILGMASTAEAKRNVHFFFGFGGPSYYNDYYYYRPYRRAYSYGYYPYSYPYYAPPAYYGGYPVYRSYVASRVSCAYGRNVVRSSGFKNVKTRECSGSSYTYTGWRKGKAFRVTVRARTGRILSVRPS